MSIKTKANTAFSDSDQAKPLRISDKTVKICICVLLALAVIAKVIDVSLWKGYNQKYYDGLISLRSIDEEKALDSTSGWSYAPYEFSDGSRKCTLAYTKPSTGHYTLRIQLDNTGFFDVYPSDEYLEPIKYDGAEYDYEIYAMIGRFDSVRYTGYVYIGSTPCGFDIKNNDALDFKYGVSDEHKQTVEKLHPEIMKIKNELQNEIVKKL